MTRELDDGAGHVAYEWMSTISAAHDLAAVPGQRNSLQNALLEAGLAHYRCVVNFCCGHFTGRHRADDIKPSDFLRRDWWPEDEEFDRRLRGRLPGINKTFAHLTWDRGIVQILWPLGFLAHEAQWAGARRPRAGASERSGVSVQDLEDPPTRRAAPRSGSAAPCA
ncbi:MAG: hypothetical protein M3527_03770 [Actinomycetota bacterium]|nr:hypothetical protein [Acidimicrobiia bacterium]MDQ3293554.1 hypothetical protein [Actinomycetota bacterium]